MPISHFSETQIPSKSKFWFWCFDFSCFRNPDVPKSKIQILAEPVSAFSSNFNPKFWNFRVYIQNFHRISLSDRKICSPDFSSTGQGTSCYGVRQEPLNAKSRFWSKRNLNFETKMKIWGFSTTAISNFGVSKQDSRGIGESDFGFWKIDFWIENLKFKIEIEF